MIKSNYKTVMKGRMREKELVLQLLHEIMENYDLWRYVVSRYQMNSDRILLLGQILLQIKEENREELLWKIMEYGSKIQEEDHIARQIFLWLYSYV